MSETQGPQFTERCGEEKGNGIVNEFGGNDDGKIIGDDKNIETVKETMHEASQLPQDSHTISRRLIKSPSSDDHPRQPGECRLLPVLVDLRSSLETNVPSSRSNQSTDPTAPKLDLNYFQDLCSTDLKTALSRLEDTLKRVDLNSLSKYTSTLNPTDKYHLLQLITTLVTNLKRAKVEESDDASSQGLPAILAPRKKRRRGNRHTIGVSTEELASARKWLEQVGQSETILIPRKNQPKFEPTSSTSSNPPLPAATNENQRIPSNQRTSDCPWGTSNDLKTCDKHIKDAINQKQSLQHRIKDNEASVLHGDLDPLHDNESPCHEDKPEKFSFNQHQVFKSNKFSAKKTKLKRANTIDIPNYLKLQADKQKFSNNQFGLRKPIDISDKSGNQYCGTQLINSSPSIPEFRPKTDNDRKFLALINKNNGNHIEPWKNPSISSTSSTPAFKSFNYRQVNSAADKNWKSRFSNIKTTFDRQPSSSSSSPASSIISTISANLRRQSTEFSDSFKVINDNSRNYVKNWDKNIVNSGKLTSIADNHGRQQIYQPIPAKDRFTHAIGSPFKKVESPKIQDLKNQNLPIVSSPLERTVPSSYLPGCATGGLLAAKVRMFDNKNQQAPELPQKLPYHQKPLNRQLKTEELPIERFRAPKFQQFINNVDDFHNNLSKNKLEKQIQTNPIIDTDNIKIPDDSTQSYQSVAVQTSARPSPRSSTPVDDLALAVFRAPENHGFYAEEDNPIYVPPKLRIPVDPVDDLDPVKHTLAPLDALGALSDANFIENQDITDDKVITRYTAAIGTLASSGKSGKSAWRDPDDEGSLRIPGRSIVLHDEMASAMKPTVALQDDVQRHNLLQLSLIKRINHDDQQNQIFEEPMIEANNTLEKINIFEEKAVPKINVTSPTKVNPTTVRAKPIDSSDEYLVSCSNKPNRSIVLSKSESWHQLAVAGRVQHLQVPQQHAKPPKAMTQKVGKNCDGNLKRMEEKVMRYFGNSGGASDGERGERKERREKRRSFEPRIMPNLLARSHTMPHVFDDSFDVDKAFDHVFEETTRDYRF